MLITGASGLIGTRLTEMLIEKNCEVAHLSRNSKPGKIKSYAWSVENGTLDGRALANTDAIIHLAGTGIAEKRWTQKRKQEILESRTKSTQLLFDCLHNSNRQVKTFISASAIGYYGFRGNEEFTEASKPGSDFLAQVVSQWEEEVDKIQSLNIRTVKIRTGIVLSEKGGALTEMVKPIKWGVGAPLGSGDQYLSWIHIDDLCRMFLFALENESMRGAYNGTALEAVTNRQLTKAIAKTLKKPLWLPHVPAFVLKVMLGEMADMVVQGSVVSSEKIRNAGFRLQFPDLDLALSDLLAR